MSRKYTLRSRAAKQEETRRRIVEAAVELHGTIGPAASTVSAVAAKAGVQRHTLYRHFPEPELILQACTAHFLAAHPPPDLKAWSGLSDLSERAHRALGDLYGYYEANRQMISLVLRDADRVPVGRGFRQLQSLVTEAVLGRVSEPRLRAFVLLATDFHTWETFVGSGAMSRGEATKLMSELIGGLAPADVEIGDARSSHR